MATPRHHNQQSGWTDFLFVLGMVATLIALANVVALSNWHASLLDHDRMTDSRAAIIHGPYDDHVDHADHAHAATGAEAPDHDVPQMDMHAVMHAMIHGLVGLVPGITVTFRRQYDVRQWFAQRSFALCGISPQALLRPPRT